MKITVSYSSVKKVIHINELKPGLLARVVDCPPDDNSRGLHVDDIVLAVRSMMTYSVSAPFDQTTAVLLIKLSPNGITDQGWWYPPSFTKVELLEPGDAVMLIQEPPPEEPCK